MEVTRAVVPWAEELLEQERREAREQGFVEFFDAVISDWPKYIRGSKSYSSVKDFMREEAIKRKHELNTRLSLV